MAKTGDSYTITLERAHLEWGTHRYTNSRGRVYGEGYIPIPAQKAYALELKNNNGTHHRDVYGANLFKCRSADQLFVGVLRAQGNQSDPLYAKQFSADKDLKAIGQWYSDICAEEGDIVQVSWVSPTEIIIQKL